MRGVGGCAIALALAIQAGNHSCPGWPRQVNHRGRRPFGRTRGMRNIAIAYVTAAIVVGLASAGAASALTLTSSDIKQGGKIADEQVFNSFGCSGQNVSPALVWSGAPKGTKSFAVSMYDPDAPTGSGFWHWWVVNIPADATSLPKGAGGGTGVPAWALPG